MSEQAFQEIATRFAALWRALSQEGDRLRPPEDTRLLVDQVRDALDRRLGRLERADVDFLANSFALEELVHEGALTRIQRLRHRDLATLHALKTLRPDQAGDAVARDLLLREARFGLMLRNPHIAATQVVLRLHDGRPAVVQEWLPFSLAARLAGGEAFSRTQIRDVLVALLLGLDAFHGAGLVHADIAPDNLLMTDANLAGLKIADFGIAIESGRRHGELGLAKAGHLDFAAPEQIAGEALDGRCDLYACGRIGMVLLERCGETAEGLPEFVRHLSAEQPGRRPQSAEAALAMLEKI